MMEEVEMMDTKANKNAKECPACRKRLAKVGRAGKFRCSNPGCPIVFIRLDDNAIDKMRLRMRQAFD